MRGEAQARVVTEVLEHMARMKRFTVPRLAKACGLNRDTVRATLSVAEERGWVAVDGFGQRLGDQERGGIPVAYRWQGVVTSCRKNGPATAREER